MIQVHPKILGCEETDKVIRKSGGAVKDETQEGYSTRIILQSLRDGKGTFREERRDWS